MAENLKNKELDEKISQIERKLLQLSKYIEQKYQQADKKMIEEEADLEVDSNSECVKELLAYGAAFQAFEEEKSLQDERVDEFEERLKTAQKEHEAARIELQKILLSICLTIKPSKPQSKGNSKAKIKEEEIQDEELNKITENQKQIEAQVMKLRAKYFVRANLHLLNAVEPSHSHLKKETRILEMMVNQENLGRKLVVAQNLLSRQFSIQSRIQEARNEAKQQKQSLLLDKNTLQSDLMMSNLAYKQVCQRYGSLQHHYFSLWSRVGEAHLNGDLTVLATMHDHHNWLLNSLDQEIRNERKRCEVLDKRLDQFSNKKINK